MSDQPPRSPLRVAVYAFLITVVVGMIVGLGLLIATGKLHDHPRERGERFGNGLGMLSVAVAVVTYFVVAARRKRGK